MTHSRVTARNYYRTMLAKQRSPTAAVRCVQPLDCEFFSACLGGRKRDQEGLCAGMHALFQFETERLAL